MTSQLPSNANVSPSAPSIGHDAAMDFVSRTRAKLSGKSQTILKRLDRVESLYVVSPRDRALKNLLDSFLEKILTLQDGQRTDGRIMFITGESGAGKSRAIKKMLADSPALRPEQRSYGVAAPAISVSLKGYCTLNTLGEMILEAAGYPIQKHIGPSQLWKSLPERLAHREVLVVHIDETHHLLKDTPKARDRKDLANVLKGAMNDTSWPVSFIVSGIPHTNELARLDTQFERRAFMLHLNDIDIEDMEERKLVIDVIEKMSAAAELDCSSMFKSDMTQCIAHAANYGFGRITQAVLAAIHNALQRGDDKLEKEHFARAYNKHSNALGDDARNPFRTEHWRLLPPGSFIIESPEK